MNMTLLKDIAKTALGIFILIYALKFLFWNLWLIPLAFGIIVLSVFVIMFLYAGHRIGEMVLDGFAKVANKLFGDKQ